MKKLKYILKYYEEILNANLSLPNSQKDFSPEN